MPDNNIFLSGTDETMTRHDRPWLEAYVSDTDAESAVRDGLSGLTDAAPVVERGGVRAAIAAMTKQATPRILLVDVDQEEEPLRALASLAQLVEPDVCVLVIGRLDTASFYREVTRELGAADYLARPLTRERVARQFGPLVQGRSPATDAALGGRSVAITGVHGGTGATTIAANLAWYFGMLLHRHTVLLDPDLHRGTAAFALNVQPGTGLRQALEAPDRIDVLLAERTAQPVAERLHVLSGEEPLTRDLAYVPGAAAALLEALRWRYNLIVADVPFAPLMLNRDLLALAHQRILVLPPTLSAVRDTLRLLALPAGPGQVQRPVLVLNRLGLPGGLSKAEVQEALKLSVDVVIPDLPRQIGSAATMGEPAVAARGPFRNGVAELAKQIGATAAETARPEAKPAARAMLRRWFGGRS